ncbi:sensor histidine kinase [Cohnella suwonensis]|uniref:histidine kinase n=1 Tax=Cohnella suwonensis TaxID=696072 RepID=A0ABW0M3E3_9BACL
MILGIVGYLTFRAVAAMLTNNAATIIQQTAVQANGRLEGILRQLDSLTTQVATNPYVQQLLLNEKDGHHATFQQRQMLHATINTIYQFADGVKSVELYSYSGQRLYPLDDTNLKMKVSRNWINRTIEAQGSMEWFGIDPNDPNSLLAIRLVTLIDQNFSPGGYLLLRINRNLFALKDPDGQEEGRNQMLLVGGDGNVIASTLAQQIDPPQIADMLQSSLKKAAIGSRTFMVVRQKSEITGWTLLILTPVDEITKGISVLRHEIFISAGIGSLLYAMLALLLSTVITKPIFRLSRTMRGARFGVLRPVAMPSSTIEIRELNHSYNEMVENINNLITLVYEKEILQNRSELKALQSQINPHFLFNTLEVLYGSLIDRNEEGLADYVLAMADLFRYTITNSNQDEWVTIREELDLIKQYLLIMKTRLEDRLNWHIDVPPYLTSYKIPKLIIQPVVENAINHGVASKMDPGTVSVSLNLSENEKDLVIHVKDNGDGIDVDMLAAINRAIQQGSVLSAKGTGMGIANVHRRIQLYYQHSSRTKGIDISSRKGEGTHVRIIVPYE